MEDDNRAKYLFLSLLQAKIGSSFVWHLGTLAPEAVVKTACRRTGGTREDLREGIARFRGAAAGLRPEQDAGVPGRGEGCGVIAAVKQGFYQVASEHAQPPPALFEDGAVPDTVSRRARRLAQGFGDGQSRRPGLSGSRSPNGVFAW